MSENHFIIACDPHNSDQPPSSRIDDYTEAMLLKQQWVVDYALRNKASLIIAGDMFHRKRPRLTSHYLVNRLIELYKPLQGRVYITPGNHDFLQSDPGMEKAPLGVLAHAGVVTLLNGEPIQIGNVSLNGLTWSHTMETTPQMYALKHLSSRWQISVYHQYALPETCTFIGPHLGFKDVYPYLPEFSIFGHYHEGFENGFIKYAEKTLINVGSLCREKAAPYNLTRIIYCGHLILPEEDRPRFARIRVPFQPANMVFDLEKRLSSLPDTEKLAEFVKFFSAEIEAVKNIDLSSFEELISLTHGLKLSSDLESTVIRLLTEANEETYG